ncbi:MAG: SDR family NAD(P)-dependent oxidoreductase [Anaerolineales bacterium]|nr:SDR family NAD(P)-dependent oxidoreductase [Anaerolineales bacterium]
MTKNIVLTGGSSGIGFELLKLLLEQGHRVAVVTRNESQATDLQNTFKPKNVEVFVADLSVQSDVLNAAAALKEKFGRVDILFNNAGVMLGKMIASKQGNEMHYEVNTLAPYSLTLKLKSALAQSSDPLVVNTSTDGLHYASKIDAGKVANPDKNQSTLTLYLNSKLALALLMKHISDELQRDRIRVINASPSGNKTKLANGSGMPIWMKPFVWLLYKPPQHGAGLLYQAAFGEQNRDKTQVYLQNNKEEKIRCEINDEQVVELLSGLKRERTDKNA